jgi:O-antigen ligase
MKDLEIFSRPHQLVIAILVIGGLIGFAVYGLTVNVF